MIQNDLSTEALAYLQTLQPDGMDTFLLERGTVRGALIHGTRMVHAMQANHHTGILETYLLGDSYMAAGLLTAMLKGNDKLGFSIECGGPIKGIDVEATASGEIRGFLHENPIEVTEPLESFDMSPFFGPGFVSITRVLEGAKEPVKGQTMMRHGSIAKDLANHFLESEQTPTLFFLSIRFTKGGAVAGAGGLFLQVMPGAEDDILSKVEDAACSMPSLGEWFSEGRLAEELIKETFSDFHPEIIGNKEISFFCPCQSERFLNFVGSLTGETKESISNEGPFPLELVCHNCGTVYSFTKEEVLSAFSQRAGK